VVVASAPGKIMLLGEYAVLEGAPAILCAVDRRTGARLASPDGKVARVTAPNFLPHPVVYEIDAGRVTWPDATAGEQARMRLFTAVVNAIIFRQPAALAALPATPDCWLDSRMLFCGNHKVGLGSSASLCVSLGGAWYCHLTGEMPDLQTLQHIHLRFQDGKGSGADVAASRVGATLVYHPSEPGYGEGRVTHWPRQLHADVYWTGSSADTGNMLSRLYAFRDESPGRYRDIMRELTTAAHRGATAFHHADHAGFLDSAGGFTAVLGRLAGLAGLPIFAGLHQRLHEQAGKSRLLYKPLGAGGGDLGAAFGDDPERLQRFRSLAHQEGATRLDLAIDPDGLKVSVLD